MLQGSLKETQYDWPSNQCVQHGEPSPLKPRTSSSCPPDEVTYISDDVSHHRTMSIALVGLISADETYSMVSTRFQTLIVLNMLSHCICMLRPMLQGMAAASSMRRQGTGRMLSSTICTLRWVNSRRAEKAHCRHLENPCPEQSQK